MSLRVVLIGASGVFGSRIARQLADGEWPARGAMPCMGLFTLDEALAALDGFAVGTQLDLLTA